MRTKTSAMIPPHLTVFLVAEKKQILSEVLVLPPFERNSLFSTGGSSF